MTIPLVPVSNHNDEYPYIPGLIVPLSQLFLSVTLRHKLNDLKVSYISHILH